MKRLIVALVVLTLCLSVFGCDKKSPQKEVSIHDVIATASKADAAKAKKWRVKKKKAEADGKLHKVKFRVTTISTKKSKVRKAIKEYNSSGIGGQITSLDKATSQGLQYILIKYEVKFPSTFPQKEFGITHCKVNFYVTGQDGGAIVYKGVKYVGKQKAYDISQSPKGYDFYAPRTFKGKAIGVIPKGCHDYTIRTDIKK